MPFMFMLMSMLIFFFFSLLFLIVNKKLYLNLNFKREKMTPFECGFLPSTSPRLPFSLQFFIISLIFLIFDIEISIIIPFNFMINLNNIYNNILIMMYFMSILIIGTMMEWLENSFNWMK